MCPGGELRSNCIKALEIKKSSSLVFCIVWHTLHCSGMAARFGNIPKCCIQWPSSLYFTLFMSPIGLIWTVMLVDTLKSRVACREKKSMTVWMSSSLPLHPQNSPPMTALLPTSLPAHYPCQTRPGPTWHGLVDLIELDIPACLGIVCWHENLPAVPVKTVDKRGICNTCRHIWELEFLRAGGGLWQRKDHQSLIVPQPGAKCRVGLVPGCCFI